MCKHPVRRIVLEQVVSLSFPRFFSDSKSSPDPGDWMKACNLSLLLLVGERIRSDLSLGDPGMSSVETQCPEADGLGRGSCVVEPAQLWVQPCTRQPDPDLK